MNYGYLFALLHTRRRGSSFPNQSTLNSGVSTILGSGTPSATRCSTNISNSLTSIDHSANARPMYRCCFGDAISEDAWPVMHAAFPD